MAPALGSSYPQTIFEISCDRFGYWYARRSDGLVVGHFTERNAAIKFAKRECRGLALLQFA